MNAVAPLAQSADTLAQSADKMGQSADTLAQSADRLTQSANTLPRPTAALAPSASANALPSTVSYDATELARYARCIKASDRVRWDIDADVLRGREFDFQRRFLPDGLSKANELPFLVPHEQRLFSQVQGRTYAYIFGLVERYINVKILELASSQSLGSQIALEGLVRFSGEELKHQELFRRIEVALSARMRGGYTKTADPDAVAQAVLSKSTWAVLALTCHIELFTQTHYQESLATDAAICPVFRDVFRHHWMEECQHAMIDELEWMREDRRLSPEARDNAVDDLIALVGAVDGILQAQAASDTAYFFANCVRSFTPREETAVRQTMLRAYRWQYIVSGVQHPHFGRLLSGVLSSEQMGRVQRALGPLVASVVGGAS